MAFVDFPKGSLLPKWSITFVWPCVRAEVGLKAAVCVGGGASDRMEVEYCSPGLALSKGNFSSLFLVKHVIPLFGAVVLNFVRPRLLPLAAEVCKAPITALK